MPRENLCAACCERTVRAFRTLITDLNQMPEDQVLRADVCIAGAGAAGITLARQLARLGRSVCLLESGALDFESVTQDLYAGTNVGMSYYELEDSRLRFFGGTTNIWGGRCALLDPIDFRRRSWVPHSGWPIGEEHLAPYYETVHEQLQLGEVQYDERVWNGLDGRAPEFDPSAFVTRFWRFDDMKERFGATRSADVFESPRIHVLLHANLSHIQVAANAAHVEYVEVRSLQGPRARVDARHYVLACGGIENARILLASRDVEEVGVGNRHDQVGRYFMEHPHGRAGQVSGPGAFALWAAFRKRFRGARPDVAPVLLPAEAVQEREGILNTAFSMKLQRDPRRGMPLTRQLYQSLKHGMAPTRHGRRVWHAYRATRALAQRALRMPVERLGTALGMRGLYLMVRGEQAPNPESRVLLVNETDALGVPRASLRWQLSAIDKRTVGVMVRLLDSELRRLELGSARLADWVETTEVAWPVDGTVGNHPIGGYHHMGTTRMSANPRHGVVDAHCAVHGYANLHVAGSSVFATAGWANPTLTILALVYRLADHLHERLAGGT